MFCPKCGKDSGEFKFCPYCGSKIPDEEVKTAVWSMGMACPHCGGTKLEGNDCAFCGAQLIIDTTDNEYANIPLGTYEGVGDKLILRENSVVIRYKVLFKAYEQEAPYHQLDRVCYIRGHGNHLGYLGMHWKDQKNLPSWVYRNSNLHDTTPVVFSEESNEEFFKVFCFLKTKAPRNAQFIMYESLIDSNN